MLKTLLQKYFSRLLLLGFLFSYLLSDAQNTIFPDTIRSCKVDSLMLDAGSGYQAYSWSNGYNSQTAWFKFSGLYSVTVEVNDTVSFTDEFEIIFVNAKIVQNDTLINCGDTLVLKGSDPYYDFLWINISTQADSVEIAPKQSDMWYTEISDPGNSVYYCLDSVFVDVNSGIVIDSVIQTSIGCPGEDKAKIKLEVSGGFPPYTYDWPAEAIPLFEDPSFAIGLTDGVKKITITDSIGCALKDEFKVKAHRLPDLELSVDPRDTVYIQKPYVTFSFENPQYDSLGVDTFYLNWWQWNFGDSVKSVAASPTHTYKKVGRYDAVLKFRTFYECEGADTISVEVKPVKLKITTVITPNGDGANDFFEIWEDTGENNTSTKSSWAQGSDDFDLNEYYISTKLIVFNRWGEKVYEVDNYENDWDGGELKDGVYFYILQCDGEYQDKTYKGSVSIFTGNPF
ncbi:MAG: gliding motility-associated C-terminal domain-containing protein [Bacteroidales bacterium]